MYYYSPSTGGFYLADVHGPRLIEVLDENEMTTWEPNPHCQIPEDAVEITAGQHGALLAAQAAGATIQAGTGGAPIAVPRAAPALAALKAHGKERLAGLAERARA